MVSDFKTMLKGASTHFNHHFGLRLAIMDMTFIATPNQRRSRRHLLLQLGSLEHSVNRLISSQGRHRREFELMPRSLQKAFLQYLGCTHVLHTKYASFLYDNEHLELPEPYQSYKEEFVTGLV